MAKILDSTGLNGNTCKVVETAKGYILNGHYYKKDTLTPVPFKTIPVPSKSEYMFLNKQQMIKNKLEIYNSYVESERVVQDINDPTITYIFTIETSQIKYIKIKEINGTIKIINESYHTYQDIWNNPYRGKGNIQEFIGQNETNIFFIIQSWDNHRYTFSGIACLNKHNMTISLVSNSYAQTSKMYGIYETDEYIYFGRTSNVNKLNLYRMSKSNLAIGEISNINRRSSFELQVGLTKGYVAEPISNPNIITFYYMNCDYKNNKYSFIRYNIDLDNSDLATMCTESVIPIVWDSNIANEIPMLSYNGEWVRQELFISEIEGTRYLNLVRLMNSYATITTNNIYNGIWTFKIRDTSLELTAFTPFSRGSRTKAVLLSSDKKFMAVGTDNNVIFLNFDETDEAYKISEILDMIPYSMGMDMSDNVWVLKSNYEVEMISTTIPTEINITFAENNYKYEGVDINTTISIDARNYQGDYLDINLDLTIDGNAIFTANGSKNTREITSDSGKIDIPITITGHGNITIYPKYITKTI